MGTWGLGPFENDTAADFVGDLADDLSNGELVVEQIAEVLTEAGGTPLDETLDADLGIEALAAAELVAAIVGRPGEALAAAGPDAGDDDPLSMDQLAAWCRTADAAKALAQTPGLAKQAIRALDRVLAADSELAELWEETAEDGRAWREDVLRLRTRLGAGR